MCWCPALPLCLCLYLMSLRISWPCLVWSCLWVTLQQGGEMRVCGWVWVSGVSSLSARERWKGWAPVRGAGRGSPSQWPGPLCRPGHGCGASHPCLCPPPAAWCGVAPHGYGSPPAGRREEWQRGLSQDKFKQYASLSAFCSPELSCTYHFFFFLHDKGTQWIPLHKALIDPFYYPLLLPGQRKKWSNRYRTHCLRLREFMCLSWLLSGTQALVCDLQF